MKKVWFIALTLAIASTLSVAYANVGVTRVGTAYSGIANPGGCEIEPNKTGAGILHVDCMNGDDSTAGKARVRYRFLKADGAIRDIATVTANIEQFGPGTCTTSWRVTAPKQSARTLRVVADNAICNVLSVTWSQ